MAANNDFPHTSAARSIENLNNMIAAYTMAAGHAPGTDVRVHAAGDDFVIVDPTQQTLAAVGGQLVLAPPPPPPSTLFTPQELNTGAVRRPEDGDADAPDSWEDLVMDSSNRNPLHRGAMVVHSNPWPRDPRGIALRDEFLEQDHFDFYMDQVLHDPDWEDNPRGMFHQHAFMDDFIERALHVPPPLTMFVAPFTIMASNDDFTNFDRHVPNPRTHQATDFMHEWGLPNTRATAPTTRSLVALAQQLAHSSLSDEDDDDLPLLEGEAEADSPHASSSKTPDLWGEGVPKPDTLYPDIRRGTCGLGTFLIACQYHYGDSYIRARAETLFHQLYDEGKEIRRREEMAPYEAHEASKDFVPLEVLNELANSIVDDMPTAPIEKQPTPKIDDQPTPPKATNPEEGGNWATNWLYRQWKKIPPITVQHELKPEDRAAIDEFAKVVREGTATAENLAPEVKQRFDQAITVLEEGVQEARFFNTTINADYVSIGIKILGHLALLTKCESRGELFRTMMHIGIDHVPLSAFFNQLGTMMKSSSAKAEAGANEPVETLFGSITTMIGGLMGTRSMSEIKDDGVRFQRVRNIVEMLHMTTSIPDYLSKLWELISEAIDYVWWFFTGKPGLISYWSMRREYEAILSEIVDYSKYHLEMVVDRRKMLRAQALLERIGTWMHRASKWKETTPLLMAMASQAMAIQGALHAVEIAMKARIRPVIIYLYGDSDVGKSVLIDLICGAVMQMYAKDLTWSPACKFTKAAGSDYWDGYLGQMFYIIDDYGQDTRMDQATEEALDIIHLGNDAPFSTNQADLKKKGVVFFKSPFIILTSNANSTEQFISVQAPIALRRRFDICIKVSRSANQEAVGHQRYVFNLVVRNKEFVATKLTTISFQNMILMAVRKAKEYTSLNERIPKFVQQAAMLFPSDNPDDYDADGKFIRKTPNPNHPPKDDMPDPTKVYDLVQRAITDRKSFAQQVEASLNTAQAAGDDNFYWPGLRVHSTAARKDTPSYTFSEINDGNGAYYYVAVARTYAQILGDHNHSFFQKLISVVTNTIGTFWYAYFWAPARCLAEVISHNVEVFHKWDYENYWQMFTNWMTLGGLVIGAGYTIYKIWTYLYPLAAAFFIESSDRAEGAYEKGADPKRVHHRQSLKTAVIKKAKDGEGQAGPTAINSPGSLAKVDYIAKASCVLTFRSSTGRTYGPVRALHVIDNHYITVMHFFYMARAAAVVYPNEKWIFHIVREDGEFEIDPDHMDWAHLNDDDVAMFHIYPEAGVGRLKATINHFIRTADINKDMDVSQGFVIRRDKRTAVTQLSFRSGSYSTAKSRYWFTVDGPQGPREIFEDSLLHYIADYESAKGDCGSILSVSNDRLNGCIIAMHAARVSGRPLAAPLTLEYLTELLEVFGEAEAAREIANFGDAATDLIKVPNHLAQHSGNSTSIVRSAFKGDPKLFPSLPAHKNKPFYREEGGRRYRVNQLYEGASRATHIPHVDINESAFADAAEAIVDFLPERGSGAVLTDVQNWNGTNDQYIKGIVVGTSNGWDEPLQHELPYKLRNFEGEPGARRSNEYFRLRVAKLENQLRTRPPLSIDINKLDPKRVPGHSDLIVAIAALKDELLTYEKILAHKARITWILPTAYLYLFRKYMAKAFAGLMATAGTSWCAVGINPTSADEWTNMFKYLQAYSEYWLPGASDIKNMDGNWHPRVHVVVRAAILAWIDHDDNLDKEMRDVLLQALQQCECVVGKHAYAINGNNRTGHPITAIYNTLLLLFGLLYAWRSVSTRLFGTPKSFDDFRTYFRFVGFGDDNVTSTHISQKWFNCKEMQIAFAEIGLTTTHPDKHTDMPDFFEWEQITFLKRRIVREPTTGKYLAPLDRDVLDNMPLWVNGKLSPAEMHHQIAESTIREEFMYGPERFANRKRDLNDQLSRLGFKPVLLHYNDLFNHWLTSNVSTYGTEQNAIPRQFVDIEDKIREGIAEADDPFPGAHHIEMPTDDPERISNDFAADLLRLRYIHLSDDGKINVHTHSQQPPRTRRPVDMMKLYDVAQAVTPEQKAESKEGIVSGTAKRVASIASSLSWIPGFGGIAAAVGGIASGVAMGAEALGFDNPALLTAPQPTVPTAAPGHATSMSAVQCEVLALDAANRIADDNLSIGSEKDVTNMAMCAAHPTLMLTGNITTSLAEDAVFCYLPCGHNIAAGTRVSGTSTVSSNHMMWGCNLHTFSRGGIYFWFYFMGNSFASCRVRVTFHPWRSAIPTSISAGDGDVISTIIDVKGDQVYRVLMPQLSRTRWLYTGKPNYVDGTAQSITDAISLNPQQNCFGFITLSMDSPLTTSTTTQTSIPYCVFAGAAPDFELAQYVGVASNLTYSFPSSSAELHPAAIRQAQVDAKRAAKKRVRQGVAQAGEGEGLAANDAAAATVTSTAQLQTQLDRAVVEDAPPLVGGLPSQSVADPYDDETPSGPELSRTYQIGSYLKRNTSTPGTVMFTSSMPYDLFGEAKIQAMLEYWRYFTCDYVEYTFMPQTTQQHSSADAVAVVPMAKGYLPASIGTSTDVAFLNPPYSHTNGRFHILGYFNGPTLKVKLPWNLPFDLLDLKYDSHRQLGMVQVVSLAALSNSSATPTTSVTVTVYARFVNPKLHGPTLDTISYPLSLRSERAGRKTRFIQEGEAQAGEGGETTSGSQFSSDILPPGTTLIPVKVGHVDNKLMMGETIKSYRQIFHRWHALGDVIYNSPTTSNTTSIGLGPTANMLIELLPWRNMRTSYLYEIIFLNSQYYSSVATTPYSNGGFFGINLIDNALNRDQPTTVSTPALPLAGEEGAIIVDTKLNSTVRIQVPYYENQRFVCPNLQNLNHYNTSKSLQVFPMFTDASNETYNATLTYQMKLADDMSLGELTWAGLISFN